ncbi:MAG: hypothetical protein ACM336_17390 [Acidobacteriota bacterium]
MRRFCLLVFCIYTITVSITTIAASGYGYGGAVAMQTPTHREELTNLGVVKMVKAGIPKQVILAKIADCDPHFDLHVASLTALQDFGVPDDVIKAMAARQERQQSEGVSLAVHHPFAEIRVSDPILTNAAVVKLVKTGVGESVILNMIGTQQGKFDTSADDVIALKQAGVPDSVIGAIVSRRAQPPRSEIIATRYPTEVGVYFRSKSDWTELLPDVVNWQSGGVLKGMASMGIVKKDVNGRINGKSSRNKVRTPVEFLVYTAEATGPTEYQLVKLHQHSDAREFRLFTGGVFHKSGGATHDVIPFETKKITSRTYLILAPPFSAGEYGFLPPEAVAYDRNRAATTLGRAYTFCVLE